MRSVLSAVAVLVAVPAFADDKPPVRALDVKNVKLTLPGLDERTERLTEFKTAEEMEKSAAFADDASREALKKQVDFSKDKLVVFAWSGSRRDKFAAAPGQDGRTAVFTYTAGGTDDLARYAHVFALPKECEVKMVP
jgi:hypothetical protein